MPSQQKEHHDWGDARADTEQRSRDLHHVRPPLVAASGLVRLRRPQREVLLKPALLLQITLDPGVAHLSGLAGLAYFPPPPPLSPAPLRMIKGTSPSKESD